MSTEEAQLQGPARSVAEAILSRRWYKSSWKTVLVSVFCCKMTKCLNKKSELLQQQKVFEDGRKHIDSETDLVYL